MNRKLKFVMLLVLFAAGTMLLCVPGCRKPPEGTVLIDFDGDGQLDALARDADRDGKPDLDEDGVPQIIAGSKVYKAAEAVDVVLPTLLTVVGALAGGGGLSAVLIILGAAWKKMKLGRNIANLVMSVQAAREKLAETPNMKTALKIVDEMLSAVQDPETEAMVRQIKKAITAARQAKGDPIAKALAEAA